MGWLARLTGREPPSLPPGARAVAWDDSLIGVRWSIRYVLPGEDEGPDNPRVKGAPTFSLQTMAYAYADLVNGDAPSFDYGAGKV